MTTTKCKLFFAFFGYTLADVCVQTLFVLLMLHTDLHHYKAPPVLPHHQLPLYYCSAA